ncbi:alkaline phosphatase family protein [Chelativorans sp. AA-79]|uniref:alkaline phosphatase family protein n=1 Tax=Chelativorans sp. AA-79 TaxID=3028735 RepID=UPI0023F65847|nr:alkaline phosphatase family protein [Chelativorans sp. AA-79]WEX10941.1 alkaline phosphatase family protein [Chelativorans sp. AA-79]
MKFLITSFDGLRPDLIGPELTPNIVRVQKIGATLSRHRTVYPSETRVAFPSLVTGATSSAHGMVGNKYVERNAKPQLYVDTADAALIDRLNRESNGGLMTSPTLGELLHNAGKSLAVLATNTPGTTRLFNHKAEGLGHLRFSGHFRETCTPNDLLAKAEAQFGALPAAPPEGEPDFTGQTWITSVFLDLVWPKLKPDVTILSYGEPDTTSHFHGTGAQATREIISFCDAQFGRVLDWWEAEGKAGGVQLIIVSDHGHITAHSRVSVIDELKGAGFALAPAPAAGVDVVVVPGQVGALYLAERSEKNLSRLVEVLTEAPWCGPIFTTPRNAVEGIAHGSLASSLVFADHERAPDAYFCFRADDEVDDFGLIGGAWYDSDRRPGLGVHGGLHPKELAAVGVVAGSAFQDCGVSSDVPSGICDFTPTILHLLGLPLPASATGRVLHEVLADVSGRPEIVQVPETLETGLNGYQQVLQRIRINGTVYLEGSAVACKSVVGRSSPAGNETDQRAGRQGARLSRARSCDISEAAALRTGA